MRVERFDLVVVGAGPAGAAAALCSSSAAVKRSSSPQSMTWFSGIDKITQLKWLAAMSGPPRRWSPLNVLR